MIEVSLKASQFETGSEVLEIMAKSNGGVVRSKTASLTECR